MLQKDQRNTRQRAAIREAFGRAGRPLSPQQVLDAAQLEVEGLGIATVYRNVKALVEDGWLSAIELPGTPTVYERAGKGYHHHFHCDRCSRVFELAGCIPSINRLAGRRFSVTGSVRNLRRMQGCRTLLNRAGSGGKAGMVDARIASCFIK